MCRNHLLNGQTGEPSLLTTAASPAQFEAQSESHARAAFTSSAASSSTNPNGTAQSSSHARTLLSPPPPVDRELLSASVNAARRRSVDVGGLALALSASSLGDEMGKGWGGWEEGEDTDAPALYAELLSDMYTQTQFAVSMPVLSPLPTISPSTRGRLIKMLDDWKFEPHKLPDDEVLACTQLLFESLMRVEGMQEAVGVTMDQLSAFLMHLRQAYRASNSYHNFQHALDVFQATHMYLHRAGVVPPVRLLLIPESDSRGRWRVDSEVRATWVGLLTKEDIFALYIAAVGHDVGHPGFNNIFMKNAKAPLSQVYDHKSALEQMHCAFLLPIMKRHGLAHLLSRELRPSSASHSFPSSSATSSSTSASTKAPTLRKLLLDTVLATDMGVHKEFMERFGRLMDHAEEFDIVQARILICQALIKCADISNPSRPHTVSQHWSAALAAEWAAQAYLEKQLQLPVSVQESANDPVAEARGQMAFISLFCLPLLKITSTAIPEMKCYADQCDTNCKLWAARLADLTERQARGQGSGQRPPGPNQPPSAATTSRTNGVPNSSSLNSRTSSSHEGAADERSLGSTPRRIRQHKGSDEVRVGDVDGAQRDTAEPNYPPVPYPQRMLSPSGLPPQDYQTVFPLSLPVHFLHEQLQLNAGFASGSARYSSTSSLNGSSIQAGASEDGDADVQVYGVNGHHGDVDMSPLSGSRSPSPFANGTPNPFTTATTTSGFSPESTLKHRPYPSLSTQSASISPTSTVPGPSEYSSPASPSEYARSRILSSSSSVSGYGSYMGSAIGSGGAEKDRDPQGSIRAAYKLSVRKKRSFHRNSWTPSLGSGTDSSNVPAVPFLPTSVTSASGTILQRTSPLGNIAAAAPSSPCLVPVTPEPMSPPATPPLKVSNDDRTDPGGDTIMSET